MPGRPLPDASRRSAGTRLPSVLLALLLVVLAGCTDRDPAPVAAAEPGPAPVGAAATTTRGAELRAALTWLLTERVHLVLAHARAVQSVDGRLDDPVVLTARRALDASSAMTVETLAGSYGNARAELLPALRTHDRTLLAHSGAVVAGERAADASALDAERIELVAAVRRVVPRLRASDVEEALSAGTTATLDAVQALADDSPRAVALQRSADEIAWGTARLLAVGVSSDRDLGLAGSPATELRGRLTGLLTEHVLLNGELAARLSDTGGDLEDPHVRAFEAALDAAAVSLAELIGRTAPETASPVLRSWREHLRELRDLAAARASGQPAPALRQPYLARLQAALAPYADSLPPGAADVGAQAAASLRTAVDAAAGGRAEAPETLRAAAADTVAPAALVAAALAEELGLS